jgi:hypothetical protein
MPHTPYCEPKLSFLPGAAHPAFRCSVSVQPLADFAALAALAAQKVLWPLPTELTLSLVKCGHCTALEAKAQQRDL